MRTRAPWAEVRVGEAEAIDDVARFDHALVLRSWNHLRDPDRAAAAIVRALRPGGTLVVADNVAFGLLRSPSPPQVTPTPSPTLSPTPSPTPAPPPTLAPALAPAPAPLLWEHYRNDDAARAHALLARLPLELLERRDVAPGTSNQWLLRYRRTGELDAQVPAPRSWRE
jgi:SAM-dependent methyltransferase